MDYKNKYLKYKQKYLNYRLKGGSNNNILNIENINCNAIDTNCCIALNKTIESINHIVNFDLSLLSSIYSNIHDKNKKINIDNIIIFNQTNIILFPIINNKNNINIELLCVNIFIFTNFIFNNIENKDIYTYIYLILFYIEDLIKLNSNYIINNLIYFIYIFLKIIYNNKKLLKILYNNNTNIIHNNTIIKYSNAINNLIIQLNTCITNTNIIDNTILSPVIIIDITNLLKIIRYKAFNKLNYIITNFINSINIDNKIISSLNEELKYDLILYIKSIINNNNIYNLIIIDSIDAIIYYLTNISKFNYYKKKQINNIYVESVNDIYKYTQLFFTCTIIELIYNNIKINLQNNNYTTELYSSIKIIYPLLNKIIKYFLDNSNIEYKYLKKINEYTNIYDENTPSHIIYQKRILLFTHIDNIKFELNKLNKLNKLKK
jgi:hypothetical protein